MYIRELMVTRILKWGNSLGLRIPKSFAKELDIEPNSEVDITVKDGRLIIRPLPRPAYALEELLSEVTKDNFHEEVEFGEPSGREVFLMAKQYVPRRCDAVWLHFSPQAGHEQAGRRPAVVVSPESYNRKVGLGQDRWKSFAH